MIDKTFFLKSLIKESLIRTVSKNIIESFILISVSLVTLICVLILIWKELEYFWNPDPTFQFVPDADFEAKLQINIDMTVAMRCDSK